MPQLITVGETMASFTPGASGALRYVPDYRMRIAGAESNLAIGVQKLGYSAGWVSRLGEDEFGHYVCNMIRAEGVDASGCVFDREHRTGIMFKETGVGETKVYYYRENSAASHLCPDDLDPAYFDGARILHLTGITPVLSENCRDTVLRAMDLADEKGIMISFDPNIRRKLWKDTDFAPMIREMTLRSQIVLLGLDEADALFGVCDPDAVFDTIFEKGRAKWVAIKNGKHGAWVADHSQRQLLPPYDCVRVEPIGAGDAFNSAFLAGILDGADVITCGRMGNISGGLAVTTPGDIEGYPSREKMDTILKNEQETYR